MATLFVDYEGGNDNYGGTSFALKASGADGAITSSTFSSATASFPNDGSLIGQYLSIFNGTIYAVYNITAWVSSTSLTIAQIAGGTALANTSARQYYIGGRWQTLTNGATAVRIAAGDTLRLMGSPAPTSLGITGTWTSSRQATTVNIGAATNATPIAITSGTHGLTTGDTVVVTGVGGNTAANGTWEVTVTSTTTFTLNGSVGNGAYTSGGTVRKRMNNLVRLASALTQTIASTGSRVAWTNVGANVTTSLNTTDYKEHQYSDSIAIAAAFTTGKAAYFATGTLNLSGYQQVSFWIKQTAGNLGATGAIDLRLCSDTVGNTAVNTISIPYLGVINQWTCITVNTGAALGSSIQSIAFYVNTDNAAQTFLLNNIIACKASSSNDSLSLSSLISKNRSDDTWYGIQSISGTRVILDMHTNALPTATGLMGYCHPSGTETVTTYKREAIKTVPASGNTATLNNVNEGGTAGNLITFEGGWNRTDMSTQTLESWFDGQNGYGYGANINQPGYVSLNKLSFVRYSGGVSGFAPSFITVTNSHNNNNNSGFFPSFGSVQSDNNTFSNIFCAANSSYGYNTGFGNSTYTNIYAFGNGFHGFFNNTAFGNSTLTNAVLWNNNDSGYSGSTNNSTLDSIDARFNSNYGISSTGTQVKILNSTAQNNGSNGLPGLLLNGSATLKNVTTAANNTGAFRIAGGWHYAFNCTFNEATELVINNNQYLNFRLFSQNHDNTANNNYIFTDYGLITSDTTTRHTASGFSWKISPLSSTVRTATYPLDFSLAKIAVAANSLVTVKAWMYRDNIGLTMQLVCKGGQIAGVPSDVVSTVSATGAWEEETITFTPTEQGVVEIIAQAYGGSTFNGWVDDMTITQA